MIENELSIINKINKNFKKKNILFYGLILLSKIINSIIKCVRQINMNIEDKEIKNK